MLRKRKADPFPEAIRRGFDVTTGLVDAAQRALIEAIPTSRDPGIPLADALDAFLTGLSAVGDAMRSWQHESSAHEWTKCSTALGEARAQAEALRLGDQDLTFEQLNAKVGDVLYPLEAFADAERAFRRR